MKLKNVLIAGSVLAVAGLGYFGWREARSQWIDAGYVGILYNATGGVQQKVLQPQRVVVGFRQRLYTYPTKLQSAKYIQAVDEGENKAADGILITTSENANTTFDVCVVYRVKPENALKVFFRVRARGCANNSVYTYPPRRERRGERDRAALRCVLN